MQDATPLSGKTGSSFDQSSLFQAGEHMHVHHLQESFGEGSYHCKDGHTVFISLSTRPVYYVQTQDGKTHTGLHQKGELLITPADMSLFTRWEGDENCLQIQLRAEFLKTIAQETMNEDCDRLQLLPTFQARDAQLEAISTLILTEHQQTLPSNQLYVDSLANILAVNLLRQHATTQPRVRIYEGGLPQRQLVQVLDYVDAHLDHAIKLETLAQLLDISQFHFSRLFKQSVGLTPHQYLTQQRIERAKALLRQTDSAIIDIAFACGFSSHSHLSRQFRQLTGMTPKAYRAS